MTLRMVLVLFADHTMPDSSEMIGALSDGNASGSLGSLGLNSTVHGDDADEQQGAMEVPHPVVTAEPQHVQPGANGEPPPTLFASNDGPIGSGSGNVTLPAPTKPPNLPSRSYASKHRSVGGGKAISKHGLFPSTSKAGETCTCENAQRNSHAPRSTTQNGSARAARSGPLVTYFRTCS